MYRLDEKGVLVASETKRVIDEIDEVVIVGNEILKLTDMKEYGENNGKQVSVHHGDAYRVAKTLEVDDRKGFIYVNGASEHAQRPGFMNYLKKKYPNSTIAMVVLDLFFGKSQICQNDRDRELITVYEGAENFKQLLEFFKGSVKHAKLRKYAETPQEKYVIFV